MLFPSSIPSILLWRHLCSIPLPSSNIAGGSARNNFATAQRKRMRLYLELARRMDHNSKVLVEYFEAEKNHPDPQRASEASALQEKAVGVRLYVLLTRGRLLVWLFIRSATLLTMPALPNLRTVCEIDGLQTYTDLKSAATAAFLRLAPEEMDSLTRNL